MQDDQGTIVAGQGGGRLVPVGLDPSVPPVAVAIATRNRGPELLGTLTRMRGLAERPPVVVVDNGSTDATSALVRAHHCEVRLVTLARNHGGAARTVGARLVDSA